MVDQVLWEEANDSEKLILSLASLFDGDFSIDWLQELSKEKTTVMLMLLEKAYEQKLLKKKELGVYRFADKKVKEEISKGIPDNHREKLHKKIAKMLINEAIDDEKAILNAADQLLRVSLDLEDCEILLNAGDRYRHKGISKKALECYQKVISSLEGKDGSEEDVFYVKTVIGYSKDRLCLSDPEKTVNLLKKALKRIEKHNEKSLAAVATLHLASVEYQTLKYVSAQKYFQKGSELASGINDKNVQNTLEACTLIYYCYTGRFKEAVKKYESLETHLYKKPPRQRLSLKVGILVGLCYAVTGQISQGLGLVNQVRDDAIAADDPDAAARASVYIAWILIIKNDLESAARQLDEELKHSKKMDLFTISIAYLLQANIYFEKSDFDKSHMFLKKILKIRNKYSFTLRGHLFEFCLASYQGIFPPIPEVKMEDEIQMSIDMGNLYNQGMGYRYKAIIQHDREEPHQIVFKTLEQSLNLLKKSGALLELGRTKEVMARYSLELGKEEDAKRYARDAAKLLLRFGRRKIADDLKHLLGDIQFTSDAFDEILNFGPEILEIQDIKKVAQRILSTVIKITEAERGALFSYQGDTSMPDIRLLAGKNLGAEDMEMADFDLSMNMIKETARTGQSKIGSSESGEGEERDGSIKSRICVPLLRRGRTIGILYHDNRLFKNPFKKEDLKILTYFASLAAIALENARAYEKIQALNQKLARERNYLEEQNIEHLQFDDFVAVSPKIKNVLSLAGRVADTDATVLILGETGVGKEMVARAIHQQSSRKDGPFIRVNCSAFSEELIASELFGHEKGSFTGANKKRIGRFELADGGTLFLDEIGDISKDIQVRLLRVLQTKKFERVGSSETIRSEFRLLTATNRNLEKAVSEGRFREDLYYRLNVFPIYVPPLRDRVEDITPLALYFLKKYADKMKKEFKGISESEMGKLLVYHWPGNVRELENVIERGVILNSEPLFNIPELTIDGTGSPAAGQLTLEELERRYITSTAKKVNWKIHGPGGAADLLGMNHSTLYSRMKKLGIKKPKRTDIKKN